MVGIINQSAEFPIVKKVEVYQFSINLQLVSVMMKLDYTT